MRLERWLKYTLPLAVVLSYTVIPSYGPDDLRKIMVPLAVGLASLGVRARFGDRFAGWLGYFSLASALAMLVDFAVMLAAFRSGAEWLAVPGGLAGAFYFYWGYFMVTFFPVIFLALAGWWGYRYCGSKAALALAAAAAFLYLGVAGYYLELRQWTLQMVAAKATGAPLEAQWAIYEREAEAFFRALVVSVGTLPVAAALAVVLYRKLRLEAYT